MKYFPLFSPIALLIISILYSCNSQAENWTEADSKREAVYLVLHTMDWSQTRNIARNPDKFFEYNPILGRYPTVSAVDRYFVATAAFQFAIAYALPSEYRESFQYISIGHDLGFVAHNFSLGINVRF